jgi:hypothetical protein
MRRFADFAELRRFLHALSPSEIERYREAGRAFLASPRFEPFATRTFVDLVASAVAADVESAG